MQKNKAILIIVIFILIVFSVLGVFYYSNFGKSGKLSLDIGDLINLDFGKAKDASDNGNIKNEVDNSNQSGSLNEEASLAKFRIISENAVSGSIFVERDNRNYIRYFEKKSGNIKEVDIETNETVLLSNDTIPKVYEVLWLNNGDSLMAQYLKEETGQPQLLSATLVKREVSKENEAKLESRSELEQSPFQLSVNFSVDSIYGISAPPDMDKVFYFTLDADSVMGSVSSVSGAKKTKIYSSPLKDWLVSWPSKNILVLTTKPSGLEAGFSYYLNATNGKRSKIMGDILGLTVLADPDLKNILYSESNNNSLILKVRNNDGARDLNFGTLPEKCVWSKKNDGVFYCGVPRVIPKALYPDLWYQGFISFSDDLWMIDINDKKTKLLLSTVDEIERAVDITKLSFDSQEEFLSFVDKKDGKLWLVDIRAD